MKKERKGASLVHAHGTVDARATRGGASRWDESPSLPIKRNGEKTGIRSWGSAPKASVRRLTRPGYHHQTAADELSECVNEEFNC